MATQKQRDSQARTKHNKIQSQCELSYAAGTPEHAAGDFTKLVAAIYESELYVSGCLHNGMPDSVLMRAWANMPFKPYVYGGTGRSDPWLDTLWELDNSK